MKHSPPHLLTKDFIRQFFHVCRPVPKQLFVQGNFPANNSNYNQIKFLTVIGSRNHTHYGKQACERLLTGLKGYPIVIVSGLAHGIDTVAHTTAINIGLTTIAFPGSGLDQSVLYPKANLSLAQKIINTGGCLISEYNLHQKTAPWIFPMRNRLMAGISHATLVIEATHSSGSRITAKLATEYNRDVFAVPGNIFTRQAEGPNALIKLGAVPVTSSEDIITGLGLETAPPSQRNLFSGSATHNQPSHQVGPSQTLTLIQQEILLRLDQPKSKNQLADELAIQFPILATYLAELELYGYIKDVLGVIYKQ